MHDPISGNALITIVLKQKLLLLLLLITERYCVAEGKTSLLFCVSAETFSYEFYYKRRFS